MFATNLEVEREGGLIEACLVDNHVLALSNNLNFSVLPGPEVDSDLETVQYDWCRQRKDVRITLLAHELKYMEGMFI